MNIVVVGSINLDFVTSACRFPQKGETLVGDSSIVSYGGKGANQAICAAKLGANVAMVGCLGNDENGQSLLRNFKANQINTDGVQVLDDVSTGIAQITIAEQDNTIIIVSGSNEKVSKEVVDKSLDKILQADMVMVQLEIPLETVRYVIELCHSANIKVILNPAPAKNFDKTLLDKVTYLTPNEIEIEQIFNEKMDDVLVKFPNKILVTSGSRGVYYHDGSKICNIPAKKLEVVDTTGAGDAFNGAFAVAITSGKKIHEAIQFGNKIAGMTIGKLGAQAAMPNKEEIND